MFYFFFFVKSTCATTRFNAIKLDPAKNPSPCTQYRKKLDVVLNIVEKGTTLTVEQIPHLIQFLLDETISTGGVSIDERGGNC